MIGRSWLLGVLVVLGLSFLATGGSAQTVPGEGAIQAQNADSYSGCRAVQLGDSIMAANTRPLAGHSVVNEAIHGDTAADVLTLQVPQLQFDLAHPCDVVILWVGTNDWGAIYNGSETLAQFQATYQAVVSAILEFIPASRLLIITSPCGTTGTQIGVVIQAEIQIAQANNVSTVWAHQYMGCPGIVADFMWDGGHPATPGWQALNPALDSAVSQLH